MTDQSDHSRILSELQRIEQAIEELTPLRSHWNGVLRLETLEGERGSKAFTCEITLRPDLALSPLRWRTLIHEMFHACSEGFFIHDFNTYRGWEEGVVEQLSRLYRRPVLERVGVAIGSEEMEGLDRHHPFNRYIVVLEAIRSEVGAQEAGFYLDLLMTPIRERYSSLVRSTLQLDEVSRRRVIAALSRSRLVLEAKVL